MACVYYYPLLLLGSFFLVFAYNIRSCVVEADLVFLNRKNSHLPRLVSRVLGVVVGFMWQPFFGPTGVSIPFSLYINILTSAAYGSSAALCVPRFLGILFNEFD